MEEETKLETPEEKTHRKERERFMRQAITQAKKAEKLMEVPIGCVIVYEGKVIARGNGDGEADGVLRVPAGDFGADAGGLHEPDAPVHAVEEQPDVF